MNKITMNILFMDHGPANSCRAGEKRGLLLDYVRATYSNNISCYSSNVKHIIFTQSDAYFEVIHVFAGDHRNLSFCLKKASCMHHA